MKNLLLIVVAVFTMSGLFAQSPVAGNTQYTLSETMNNTYIIDYHSLVTEGTYPVEEGIGHIDLEVLTKTIDADYDANNYYVAAKNDCGALYVESKLPIPVGGSLSFLIKYRVFDTQGNKSNIGYIILTVNDVVNPQTNMADNCTDI